jgi:5,10-methylene-tetrahydrofolate dehydrogenase/methenyl tetrahydrofolate cyclohydrolase
MVATDIDGKAIAKTIRMELKNQVEAMRPVQPGLAVILVGDRRDSQTYVNMKKKACAECGIASFGYDFAASASQAEVMECIAECNQNPAIDGILVQLPLPPHMQEHVVLDSIDPDKDVDGLHPINVAHLSSTSTHTGNIRLDWNKLNEIPFPIPCTPQGCIELLDRVGVEIAGKRAVVIGRSNLVGIPVALLLMHRNATVTIVHSKTVNTANVVKEADIVIAAVGRAFLVKKEWLKEGAVVIDVGINSIDDVTVKKGYRLVGDVDYEDARQVASQVTPVPGGVGPMTIAMLMRNTVNACVRHRASKEASDVGEEKKVE